MYVFWYVGVYAFLIFINEFCNYPQAGSLHGKFIDATPFASSVDKKDGKERSERSSLVDELGPMLASHGFNYHGSEVLYSGFYGTEMTCEIFMGPVYYQRLRHMVSDKFQVSYVFLFLSYFCLVLTAESLLICIAIF